MAHYWGSFAGGFAQGLRNGWDLGEKITDSIARGRFQRSTDEADKKADEAYAKLDEEKSAGEKAKARKGARERAIDTGSLTTSSPLEATTGGAPKLPEETSALPASITADQMASPYIGTQQPAPAESSKMAQAMPFSPSDRTAVEPPSEGSPLDYIPSQAVDSALPAPTHPSDRETALSDSEYMRRRQAISSQQKRDTLRAQLDYLKYKNPEAYMEVKEKLYDMDTDASIQQVIEGMEAGDPTAIGQAVRTLSDMGYFPEGARPREGKNDTVELVDKDGKVLWGGKLTQDLVKRGIPLFAMAAKAKARNDFKSMYDLQDKVRSDRRADNAEKRAEELLRYQIANGNRNYELAVKRFGWEQVRGQLALKMQAEQMDQAERHFQRTQGETEYQHDVGNWFKMAGMNGYSASSKGGSAPGGAENWAMTNLPSGTKLGEDENGSTAVVNTRTGEVMGSYNKDIRNAVPSYARTPAEEKTQKDLAAKGWVDGFAYDDSGRVKYTMRNPKNGQYVFADDPTHIYESQDKRPPLPPFPKRGQRWSPEDQGTALPSRTGRDSPKAETSHTSVSETRSETQKAQAAESSLYDKDPGRTAPVAMDSGMPDVPAATPEEHQQGSALQQAEARLKELEDQRLQNGWSWGWEMEHRRALLDYRQLKFGTARGEAAPEEAPAQSPLLGKDPGRTAPVAMDSGMPDVPASKKESALPASKYKPEDFFEAYAKKPPESVDSHLDTDADRRVTARRGDEYNKLGAHEYADHEYKWGASRDYGAPITGADNFRRQYSNGSLDYKVDPEMAKHADAASRGQAGRYQRAEVYDDAKKPGKKETALSRKRNAAADDFYDAYKERGYGPKRGSYDPIGKILDDTHVTKKEKAIKWPKSEAEMDKDVARWEKKFPKILKDAQKPREQDKPVRRDPEDYRYAFESKSKLGKKYFDVKEVITSPKGSAEWSNNEAHAAHVLALPAMAELINNGVEVEYITADRLKKLWTTVLKGDIDGASQHFFRRAAKEMLDQVRSLNLNEIDRKEWAKDYLEAKRIQIRERGKRPVHEIMRELKGKKAKSKKEAK